MLWKEKGVSDDSSMCFFFPDEEFRSHFLCMISCGYFHTDHRYRVSNDGGRPPLFIYLISGHMNVEYNGSAYEASAGEILLLNCAHPHSYQTLENGEFLFFHFSGNQAESLSDYLIAQNHSPVFSSSRNETIYSNIKEPLMRLCYEETADEVRMSTLVYETLCQLGSAESSESTPSASQLSPISASAIEYIRQNITHKLTLEMIADAVGLSPYHFARRFHNETGYAPIEYVSLTKLRYARLMLRTTSTTISEIAEHLGYSSDAAFINAFKARQGITPRQYRLQADDRSRNTL